MKNRFRFFIKRCRYKKQDRRIFFGSSYTQKLTESRGIYTYTANWHYLKNNNRKLSVHYACMAQHLCLTVVQTLQKYCARNLTELGLSWGSAHGSTCSNTEQVVLTQAILSNPIICISNDGQMNERKLSSFSPIFGVIHIGTEGWWPKVRLRSKNWIF